MRSRGPSPLYVIIITASTEISGKIFSVQHSSYAMSKFELGRPSESGKNGWEQFL